MVVLFVCSFFSSAVLLLLVMCFLRLVGFYCFSSATMLWRIIQPSAVFYENF